MSADQSAAIDSTVGQARMSALLGASRFLTRDSVTPARGAVGNNATSVSRSETSATAARVPMGSAGLPIAETATVVVSPEAPGPLAQATVGVTGVEAVAKPATEVNLDTAAAGYSGSGYSASAYLGDCRGLGLGQSAASVCSAVRSLFGSLTIGGYRAGDTGDHGAGRAADIMVSDFAQGDAIAAFVQAHAGELNVKYVIWRQRYWAPGNDWRLMADRGSPTENHMDHVHVSVN
ncbi:MAG TPA: hypothetical protein PLX71_00145 [Phycicoccus sp.]|nr:hypothetical protein [Phycicoccus sp.]